MGRPKEVLFFAKELAKDVTPIAAAVGVAEFTRSIGWTTFAIILGGGYAGYRRMRHFFRGVQIGIAENKRQQTQRTGRIIDGTWSDGERL